MSAECSRRGFLGMAGCFASLLLALGLPASATVTWADGIAAGDERQYPVPPADGVTIDRTAQVIIVRLNGKMFALALACPHQNAAVKWLPDDHRFQCTRHDSKYRPDGTYIGGRATRNLDRYPVRKDGDSLYVDVTRVFRSDQDSKGWMRDYVDV